MRLARASKNASARTRLKPGTKRPARIEAYWQFVVRETCSVLAKIMSFVAIAALFLVMSLDGSQIVLPRINELLQAWAGPSLNGQEISVGSVEFSLGQGDIPAGLRLSDVELNSGEMSVVLPQVDTQFTMLNGVQGLIRPKTIAVSGTRINFIRDMQSRFAIVTANGDEVVFLGAGSDVSADTDLSELINGLAQFGDLAVLEELDQVSLTGIVVTFTDQRTGQRWQSTNASAELRRDKDQLHASLDVALSGDSNDPMTVQTRLSTDMSGGETTVTAKFSNVPPADLATQVSVLDWMSVIDGRVDGSLSLQYTNAAVLTSMSGVLELGSGKVEPVPGQTIGFDSAKSYFSYNPVTDVFRVQSLTLDTAFGALSSAGNVVPERGTDGRITALVGQMDISRLNIDVPDYLADRLTFDSGHMTARFGVDPFRIDIGEAVLVEGGSRISVNGRVKPGRDTWDVALNAGVTDISHARALDLWPEAFRPNLRGWLSNQLDAGQISSLTAHLRMPDGSPEIGLDFAFSDAQARILNTMPPIEAGRGYGSLVGDRLNVTLESGHAQIAGLSPIDLAGSQFIIPDVRIDKAPARAIIEAKGAIPALLSAINLQPLGLMDKFGRDTNLANGTAAVQAELAFELIKDLKARDVLAVVTAAMSGVSSDRIVPGRLLTADALTMHASNDALSVSGDAVLSDVPVQFEYSQAFDGENTDGGQIKGHVPVTMANLRNLGIDLPKNAISGTGAGRFQIDLRGEDAPEYSVTVGMGGNGISVPELNWRKGQGPAARVAISGVLSDPVTVDDLDFSGPGLSARGRLVLAKSGLQRAEFSRLSVGGWLDAPLIWAPRENQAEIRGGTIDLRNGPDLGETSQGNTKLVLAPNSVIVSDGVQLTNFRGNIDTNGGTRGRFSAKVNGGAGVTGVIQPGAAIFIQAEDGGGALRDAGFFSKASGGTLRVSLTPLASGVFDGRFSLQKTRARNAPVLAEMLSIISVFGLIDSLSGKGIAFDDVQGWFTLSGDQLTISRARAVGPSMGLTLAGSYQLNNDRLDMYGVLSPLYFVNGLAGRIPGLGRLLGGRNGEGVLGASFTVGGTANNPTTSVNPLSLLTPGATREIFVTRPALQPAKN